MNVSNDKLLIIDFCKYIKIEISEHEIDKFLSTRPTSSDISIDGLVAKYEDIVKFFKPSSNNPN